MTEEEKALLLIVARAVHGHLKYGPRDVAYGKLCLDALNEALDPFRNMEKATPGNRALPPWRPISSPPHSGTLVWVFVVAHKDRPAEQTIYRYYKHTNWFMYEGLEITHWMPLQAVWLTPPGADTSTPYPLAVPNLGGEFALYF